MTSCKYQRLGVLAARQAKVLPLKRCGRASMNRQEETQKARLGVGLLLFSCSPDVTWHTPRPGWRPARLSIPLDCNNFPARARVPVVSARNGRRKFPSFVMLHNSPGSICFDGSWLRKCCPVRDPQASEVENVRESLTSRTSPNTPSGVSASRVGIAWQRLRQVPQFWVRSRMGTASAKLALKYAQSIHHHVSIVHPFFQLLPHHPQ